MDFLGITLGLFVIFTASLVLMLVVFVLGLAGKIVLSTWIWLALVFGFLVLSMIVFIFYWMLREEIKRKKGHNNER